MLKIILKILIAMTLVVWVTGFFWFWGSLYSVLVLGLIIVAFIVIFIGFIRDEDVW